MILKPFRERAPPSTASLKARIQKFDTAVCTISPQQQDDQYTQQQKTRIFRKDFDQIKSFQRRGPFFTSGTLFVLQVEIYHGTGLKKLVLWAVGGVLQWVYGYYCCRSIRQPPLSCSKRRVLKIKADYLVRQLSSWPILPVLLFREHACAIKIKTLLLLLLLQNSTRSANRNSNSFTTKTGAAVHSSIIPLLLYALYRYYSSIHVLLQ